MAETFLTLKSKVATWMGADSTNRFPEAVRGDCVNMAIRGLLKKYELRFGEVVDTLPVSAGDHDVAMPTRFISFDSLWYINSDSALVELEYVGKKAYNRRYPNPSDTSSRANPIHYTFFGSVVYLGPTPLVDITLNQEYYAYLADLVEDGDTNVFTADEWEPIFWMAMKRASKFLNEPMRLVEWEEEMRESEDALVRGHTRARSRGKVAISRIPGSVYDGR